MANENKDSMDLHNYIERNNKKFADFDDNSQFFVPNGNVLNASLLKHLERKVTHNGYVPTYPFMLSYQKYCGKEFKDLGNIFTDTELFFGVDEDGVKTSPGNVLFFTIHGCTLERLLYGKKDESDLLGLSEGLHVGNKYLDESNPCNQKQFSGLADGTTCFGKIPMYSIDEAPNVDTLVPFGKYGVWFDATDMEFANIRNSIQKSVGYVSPESQILLDPIKYVSGRHEGMFVNDFAEQKIDWQSMFSDVKSAKTLLTLYSGNTIYPYIRDFRAE